MHLTNLCICHTSLATNKTIWKTTAIHCLPRMLTDIGTVNKRRCRHYDIKCSHQLQCGNCKFMFRCQCGTYLCKHVVQWPAAGNVIFIQVWNKCHGYRLQYLTYVCSALCNSHVQCCVFTDVLKWQYTASLILQAHPEALGHIIKRRIKLFSNNI